MTYRIIRNSVLGLALSVSAIGLAHADTIKLWTPEEQPERIAVQEKIAADFEAKTGHTVEIIPVTEKDLGTRATAAFAAGDLPDIIYHSMAAKLVGGSRPFSSNRSFR